MPKFYVTLAAPATIRLTVEVEATNSVAAVDQVERLEARDALEATRLVDTLIQPSNEALAGYDDVLGDRGWRYRAAGVELSSEGFSAERSERFGLRALDDLCKLRDEIATKGPSGQLDRLDAAIDYFAAREGS
jgi:hypothetical protein